jgi:hypothetical protein
MWRPRERGQCRVKWRRRPESGGGAKWSAANRAAPRPSRRVGASGRSAESLPCSCDFVGKQTSSPPDHSFAPPCRSSTTDSPGFIPIESERISALLRWRPANPRPRSHASIDHVLDAATAGRRSWNASMGVAGNDPAGGSPAGVVDVRLGYDWRPQSGAYIVAGGRRSRRGHSPDVARVGALDRAFALHHPPRFGDSHRVGDVEMGGGGACRLERRRRARDQRVYRWDGAPVVANAGVV